jgi:hypothetical protein
VHPFGAVKSDRERRGRYGVLGHDVPDGFGRRLARSPVWKG